ncbi:MAG: restriction endonuclease subunit S [Microbacteriaceae bacterium]|nr:restriction endonuclease subunit S [Microbacteriaceae bacterium]
MSGLPAGWSAATLAEVTKAPKKVNPVTTGRQSIRYLEISGIDGERHVVTSADPVESAAAPSRCRQPIRAGDTVFSTVRPYLERIAYIDDSLDNEFASTGFCVLRPTSDLDPRYLFHFASSPLLLDQVLPLQKGVSYPAVLDREVRGARIPVPPLDEQRRIVAILEDHLSRLAAASSSLIASKSKAAALLQSALTSGFGVGSDGVPLFDLVDGITAGKSFATFGRRAADGEWGIIKVSAMTWGEFDPGENKAVDAGRADPRFEITEGDLLVSRANTEGLVGASVMVGEVRPMLLLSDKSLRVSPKPGVSTEWLWRSLQTPSARRQMSRLATGTKDSMRNISQSSLLKVRLRHASPDQQDAAVDEFRVISDEVRRLEALASLQSSRVTALRRSLLSAAFRGDLTGSAQSAA